MKRFAFLLLLVGCFVPFASAQSTDTEHVQIGAFADYFRLSQTRTDLVGVGARVSFVGYRYLKFEGEMSYDFDRAFTENFTDSTGTLNIQRSSLRAIHGEFGPKLNLGHSAVHPFVTLKGGFVDFRLDNRPATLGTFFSSVDNLRARNVNAVLYPGGGVEGHWGPIGLRLDVGDEMYFNNGTHNNLRVAFGPFIRF